MNKIIIIAIAFFIGLGACTRDKEIKLDTPADADKAGPEIRMDSFPISVGHIWAYDNGDTVRAVKDTSINGVRAVKMVKTNGQYSAAVYYANLSDGLHIVATNWKPFFKEITYPFTQSDTVSSRLIIPDEPVLVAKLPIVAANHWSITIPAGSVNQTRQWMGFVTVTTTAGTFDCAKLYTGTCYEYYSSKGIVQTADIINCITTPCPQPKVKLVYMNF